jgi:hypothetical protein
MPPPCSKGGKSGTGGAAGVVAAGGAAVAFGTAASVALLLPVVGCGGAGGDVVAFPARPVAGVVAGGLAAVVVVV